MADPIVTITDRAEWERVLVNAQPQWREVSSDFEWFRGGTGIVYRWEAGRD